MDVMDFIGDYAEYDKENRIIWKVDEHGVRENFLDIRLNNDALIRSEDGSVDHKKTVEFIEELGEWISHAINEKLERDRG